MARNVAGLVAFVAFWSTTAFVVVETVRSGQAHVPRRQYVIYSLLWFGGIFVAAPAGMVVAAALFGDRPASIIVGATISVAACWTVAIVLLIRWKRERSRDGGAARRR